MRNDDRCGANLNLGQVYGCTQSVSRITPDAAPTGSDDLSRSVEFGWKCEQQSAQLASGDCAEESLPHDANSHMDNLSGLRPL
jgi:hypothetical protein